MRRQQLEAAAKGFQAVLVVAADDSNAQRGREQTLQAVVARSQKSADDFQFDAAQRDAALAAELGLRRPSGNNWRSACSAQQAQRVLQQPAVSTAQRERQLRDHLRKIERAERAGQWISPPGTARSTHCAKPSRWLPAMRG